MNKSHFMAESQVRGWIVTALSPAHRAFISFGCRQAWQERVVLLLQFVTYTLLITIFSSIFLITPFKELPTTIALNANVMIWYIIVTELVTFSGGQNFQGVRSDVVGGEFSASLQRPKSYFRTKLWIWVGTNLVRSSVFLLLGTMLGLIFTRGFPYHWTQIPFLLLSIYISTLIYCAIHFMLGLIEVWGPYARSAMWVSQKSGFLLGGLILPLQLYPQWLQTLAWATPYPAMLNIPGKIVFDPSLTDMAAGLAKQILWLVITIGAGFFIEARAYDIIRKRGQ